MTWVFLFFKKMISFVFILTFSINFQVRLHTVWSGVGCQRYSCSHLGQFACWPSELLQQRFGEGLGHFWKWDAVRANSLLSHRRKSEHIQLLSPQDTSRPSKQAVTLLGRQDPIQSHLGSEAVRGQEQGILTHRLVTAVINFYDCKGGEKGGRNRLIIIGF